MHEPINIRAQWWWTAKFSDLKLMVTRYVVHENNRFKLFFHPILCLLGQSTVRICGWSFWVYLSMSLLFLSAHVITHTCVYVAIVGSSYLFCPQRIRLAVIVILCLLYYIYLQFEKMFFSDADYFPRSDQTILSLSHLPFHLYVILAFCILIHTVTDMIVLYAELGVTLELMRAVGARSCCKNDCTDNYESKNAHTSRKLTASTFRSTLLVSVCRSRRFLLWQTVNRHIAPLTIAVLHGILLFVLSMFTYTQSLHSYMFYGVDLGHMRSLIQSKNKRVREKTTR